MKILAMSDIHANDSNFNSIEKIIEIADPSKYDYWILHGDIWDAVKDPRLTPDVQSLLAMVSVWVSRGKTVIFIPGNHDYTKNKIVEREFEKSGALVVTKEFQIEDKIFIHGHRHDKFIQAKVKIPFIKYELKYGLWLSRTIIKFHNWIDKTWVSRKYCEGDFQGYVRKNWKWVQKRLDKIENDSGIEISASEEYKGISTLIMGHTHQPHIIKINEVTVVNSGDWIQHETFVEIDESGIYLWAFNEAGFKYLLEGKKF